MSLRKRRRWMSTTRCDHLQSYEEVERAEVVEELELVGGEGEHMVAIIPS